MRNATDLKARMVDMASELFRTQGYMRTTNKQIAEALNCTTAALYYYFPAGKRELLRTAAQVQSQLARNVLARVNSAAPLSGLLAQLSQTITQELANISAQSSWLYMELEALEAPDQRFVQEQFLLIQAGLAEQLHRLVPDQAESYQYAWLILSAIAGYQAIFHRMGIHQLAPQFDSTVLLELVMRCIGFSPQRNA